MMFALRCHLRSPPPPRFDAALAELTAESGSARPWHSLEIDWHLWEEGEALDAAKSIPPPHHTLTVFY